MDGLLSLKEIQQLKFGPLNSIWDAEGYSLKGHVDECTGELYVHLSIFEKDKWSIALYKSMLDDWFEIQEYLKDKFEISMMKTIIADSDTVTEKFLHLFGFIAEDSYFEVEDGSKYTIMKAEF